MLSSSEVVSRGYRQFAARSSAGQSTLITKREVGGSSPSACPRARWRKKTSASPLFLTKIFNYVNFACRLLFVNSLLLVSKQGRVSMSFELKMGLFTLAILLFTLGLLVILRIKYRRDRRPFRARQRAMTFTSATWKIYEIKISRIFITATIRLAHNPSLRCEELEFALDHPDTKLLRQKMALELINFTHTDEAVSKDLSKRSSYLRVA